jgi:hypothetical protein
MNHNSTDISQITFESTHLGNTGLVMRMAIIQAMQRSGVAYARGRTPLNTQRPNAIDWKPISPVSQTKQVFRTIRAGARIGQKSQTIFY